MREQRCEIRIYDGAFNWVGETSRAESVQFKRNLYGAGTFEIHIQPDKNGAMELMRRGNIIMINKDRNKTGIVRDFYINESREGAHITVFGATGNGLCMQRVTVPPTQAQVSDAYGWDKVKGSAETVLKHYVKRNMTEPYDATRKFPNLYLAPDLKRGAELPWKSRYTMLSDELYNIASYAEMGYGITANIQNKRWEFEVIEGEDRTAGQRILSPVTFKTEYRNVGNYKYTESFQNYKSTGYAGGKGEDENRLVYTLGAEHKGFSRWEVFLDCGNAEDIDELAYYGRQKLSTYKEARTISADMLAGAFTYEKDFFIGDKVSLHISRLGLNIDTRVTEVKEIWERQTGYKAEIKLGGKAPDIFTVLMERKEVR